MIDPGASAEPAAPQTPPLAGPVVHPIEDPPWSGWDVTFLAVVSVLLTLITLLVLSYVVRRIAYPALPWLEVLKFPEVIVGGQLIAYVLVFCLMYALVAGVHRQHFFPALRWNWPRGSGWYLLGGLALSVGLQMVARLLPIPKNLPMDQFFRTPRQAWLLCIFSVTLAPLIEELFFRGFLYPVLARRFGMVAGIFLTAVGFASIHGSQLTYAWGPVLIIFTVGLVLTLVRAVTKSVGASILLHMGYNGTIAIAMYVGTDGFRHLERLSQ